MYKKTSDVYQVNQNVPVNRPIDYNPKYVETKSYGVSAVKKNKLFRMPEVSASLGLKHGKLKQNLKQCTQNT